MSYISGWFGSLIQYFFHLTGSYGWAIIILSVLLRILTAPVQHMQVLSARRMQAVEPLRKAIEKRYKGDPKRIQEETARLWKEHKVSPTAGCLPLLVQLPILWAFFGALSHLQYQGTASFWWIADLSRPDPWILPILAGVTTFLQSKLTMPNTQTDTASQTMLYMMPLLILWMSRSFAAGLSLYWVVTNLLAIAQQVIYPAGGRKRGPVPEKGAAAS